MCRSNKIDGFFFRKFASSRMAWKRSSRIFVYHYLHSHVDNDLLRFSYDLTRPPRMADSTSISSNFGAVWKLRENQGHEKFHRIRKRQSSRSFVACEFNFARCFAAHSYVCTFARLLLLLFGITFRANIEMHEPFENCSFFPSKYTLLFQHTCN